MDKHKLLTSSLLTSSLLTIALAGCGGGGGGYTGQTPGSNGQTVIGTAGNDSWTVTGGWTGTLDGLAGTDTLNLGTSVRSAYTIGKNTDGSFSVDSVSGASTALHARLLNMEVLVFDSGRDVLDLTKL
jgi:hypothetical protein